MPDISFPTTRAIMRWILAAFFIAGGVAHLAVPAEFLKITPDWVSFAPRVIFVTGLCEIAGVLALVTKPLRTSAGIALAVYAVSVWPANFKHAFGGIDIPHLSSSWWYHAPRLALQPVIAWWALFAQASLTGLLRHDPGFRFAQSGLLPLRAVQFERRRAAAQRFAKV